MARKSKRKKGGKVEEQMGGEQGRGISKEWLL